MKQIDQTTEPYLLALAQAIQALAGKLTEAQAQQALVPVLKQFDRTTDPDVLGALAQAIEALPAKLTEAQAQQALAEVMKQIVPAKRTDKTSGAEGQESFATRTVQTNGTTILMMMSMLSQIQGRAGRLPRIGNISPLPAWAWRLSTGAEADRGAGATGARPVLKQFDRTTDPSAPRTGAFDPGAAGEADRGAGAAGARPGAEADRPDDRSRSLRRWPRRSRRCRRS